MAALLTALGIAVKILPIVFELVKIAEQQLSASGAGASKKELVLGVVGAATQEFGGDLGVEPQKVESIVSKVIDLVVGLLNKSGVFISVIRSG